MAGIEERAKELAGNHRQTGSNLLWSAEPEDGEKWALLSINHRGADTVTRANAKVIERELCEQYPDDAHIERFSDWLVGSADNLVLRVYSPSGEVTDAFKAYFTLERQMADYPLLDEELYSAMEAEEVAKTIRQAADQLRDGELKADLPEGWEIEVWRKLEENDSDIRGDDWWPKEEYLEQALTSLGYLVTPSEAIEA